MSKIRKRNFTARLHINRHADVFKVRKKEPRGGARNLVLEALEELEEINADGFDIKANRKEFEDVRVKSTKGDI